MSKEIREIAERLVAICEPGTGVWTLNQLTDAIDQALRDRDERAAKIAEQHEGHGEWCASASGDCQSLTVKAIATAIRNGTL